MSNTIEINRSGGASFVLPTIRKNISRIKHKDTKDYYAKMLHNCIVSGQEKKLIFINNQVNMILDIQKAGLHHEKGN